MNFWSMLGFGSGVGDGTEGLIQTEGPKDALEISKSMPELRSGSSGKPPVLTLPNATDPMMAFRVAGDVVIEPPTYPNFQLTPSRNYKFQFHGVLTDRLIGVFGYDFFVNGECKDRAVAVRGTEIWLYDQGERVDDDLTLIRLARLRDDDFGGAKRWLRGAPHMRSQFGDRVHVGVVDGSQAPPRAKFSDEEYAEMYARLLRESDRVAAKLVATGHELRNVQKQFDVAQESFRKAGEMHVAFMERMTKFAAKIGNLDRHVAED